jgi:hypothetical protein
VPGTYTATLVAAGQEQSTQFEVRGDPNVGASQADYQARYTAARRAMDLQTRLNEMVTAIRDIDDQVDNTLSAIEGKDIPNAAAIRETAGTAKGQLDALSNETNRPPTGMGYRDWPRLVEQLRFVAGGINGAQARPTAGQIEVLQLVEEATAQRAAELGAIIEGPISELNRLLQNQPKILTNWQTRRVIS